MVTIDLEETNLEEIPFRRIKDSAADSNWIECWVEELQFHGMGGPSKLENILQIFIDWAKSQKKGWLKPPNPMTLEERQQYEDQMLFASLGDEVEGEKCQHEGCNRDRIRYSVMCRQHHFEMVTGRPVPKRTH
jgi:hypothetical protein